MEKLNFEISAVTDIGISKDKNQDSYHIRLCNSILGPVVFAILCDGMGGLAEGEVASATVVRQFCAWADKRLPELCEKGGFSSNLYKEWTHIIETCNKKLVAYGEQKGSQLGTTATVLLLAEDKYYIIHVGDTRIYEITDKVKVLTTDHSLVAKELELGILSPEQAKSDTRKHILLQCIGVLGELRPEFITGKIVKGAVYLLCSDGFRHKITSEEIYEYFNSDIIQESTLYYNLKKLVELNKERKEKDNITVVGIKTDARKQDSEEKVYA